MTTLVDAFIKPHMSNYLKIIAEELSPDLRLCPLLVMQSAGVVLSAEQVVDKPITTALSGPAAGAHAAPAAWRPSPPQASPAGRPSGSSLKISCPVLTVGEKYIFVKNCRNLIYM